MTPELEDWETVRAALNFAVGMLPSSEDWDTEADHRYNSADAALTRLQATMNELEAEIERLKERSERLLKRLVALMRDLHETRDLPMPETYITLAKHNAQLMRERDTLQATIDKVGKLPTKLRDRAQALRERPGWEVHDIEDHLLSVRASEDDYCADELEALLIPDPPEVPDMHTPETTEER